MKKQFVLLFIVSFLNNYSAYQSEDVLDRLGYTELHKDVSIGNHFSISSILDLFPSLLNAQNKVGKTALHLAARGGNGLGYLECVKDLLERGADINIKDDFGNTALHDAVVGGNPEIVKALLDAGIDKDHYYEKFFELEVSHNNHKITELLKNHKKK